MRSAGRPVSLLGTLISRWRTSSPWELKQPNLLLNTERSPGWYGQSSITSAFQPLLFCFLLQCCCSKKQEVFKKTYCHNLMIDWGLCRGRSGPGPREEGAASGVSTLLGRQGEEGLLLTTRKKQVCATRAKARTKTFSEDFYLFSFRE